MSKVLLDHLTIELTNRCNMQPICAHCFRGTPRNSDLDKKAIDNLLCQVDLINELTVTGGEPLVRFDMLEYLLREVMRRKICLKAFGITTNGLLCPEPFISLMVEINNYIRSCKGKYDREDPATFRTIVSVSVDQFHNNGAGEQFINKCSKTFERSGIILKRIFGGIFVNRKGLARKLDFGEVVDEPPHTAAIDVLVPGKRMAHCHPLSLGCLYYFEAGKRNAPFVICPLYLNADGKLFLGEIGNSEYSKQKDEFVITDLHQKHDLIESIKKYNKGRKLCIGCLSDQDKLHSVKVDADEINRFELERNIEKCSSVCDPAMSQFLEIPDTIRKRCIEIIQEIIEICETNRNCAVEDILNRRNINFPDLSPYLKAPEKIAFDDDDFRFFLKALTPIPEDNNLPYCD